MVQAWDLIRLGDRYYRIFTQFYAVALMFSNVTMTNSSWTQNHISNLLQLGRNSYLSSLLNFDRRPLSPNTDMTNVLDERRAFVHDPPRIVYPPCDTEEFLRLGKLDARKPVMVSLAQFRPEKDHAKQVEALALLFERHPEWRGNGVRLVLMGSCRNEEDERRIRGLEELANRLGVRVSQSGKGMGPCADGAVCSGIYGICRQRAVLSNCSAAGRGVNRVEYHG